MTVHCLHLRDGNRKWWVVATGDIAMPGKLNEPLEKVRDRWDATHGKPDRAVVYVGLHSKAEAAATLADLVLGTETQS